jgi:uncharacterized RDD family membrane protein YckC
MDNYATFWQRLAAMWIDFFVLLPLMVVQGLLESVSKGAALALVVPMAVAYSAYTIYCHGRFGQTVGKRVMGIRVMRTNGERIGWREAWLRSSVELFFSVLGVIGTFVALLTIADTDYYGVGWMQRAQNVVGLQPAWLSWTGTATQIWVWSEVVVMLLNKRRRALHDFIAGTVVTSEQRNPDAQTHAA